MIILIFFIFLNSLAATSSFDTTTTSKSNSNHPNLIRIKSSEAQDLLLKELEINSNYSLDFREYSTQIRLVHITILIGLGGIIFLSNLRGRYFPHFVLIFLIYIGFVYVKETIYRDIVSRINSRYIEIYKTHAWLSEKSDTSLVVACFKDTSKFNRDTINIIPDLTEKNYKKKIELAANPDLETSYIYLFILMSLFIFSITKKDNKEKIIMRFPCLKNERYRFVITFTLIFLCVFFLFNIIKSLGIFDVVFPN